MLLENRGERGGEGEREKGILRRWGEKGVGRKLVREEGRGKVKVLRGEENFEV